MAIAIGDAVCMVAYPAETGIVVAYDRRDDYGAPNARLVVEWDGADYSTSVRPSSLKLT